MKRRASKPPLKQPTPPEMLESLLSIVQTHFYPNHFKQFQQDRARLLDWVLLWPAAWLEEKAVTLPPARYLEIMRDIILNAVRHGDLSNIKYLPGWLRTTVESHFRIHGEDYYEEAKSIRRVAEHVVLTLGKLRAPEPDAVAELAKMKRLMKAARFKKSIDKPIKKQQLTLL